MYSIKTSRALNGQVLVSDAIWHAIDKAKYLILKFGQLTKKLVVSPGADLKDDEIILPEQITSKVIIPDLPYQARFEGGTLRLGPVIGFNPDARFYRRPKGLLLRFSQFDQVGGLIFIFRPRTVNTEDLTIRGYYYNPRTGDFVEGIFPYPDAVFSRTFINQTVYRSLTRNISKSRVFNRPSYIGKRRFWRLMSTSDEVKQHLPPTRIYKGVDQVVRLLERWGSLYLKPWNLSRGRGVYRLSIKGREYTLTDSNGNTSVASSKHELERTLTKALQRKYVVQKEIVAQRAERKVDFRAYLQKDGSMQWQLAGVETKVAKPGSIISNSAMRERMLPGMEALRELFEMDRREAAQKFSEIEELCKGALRVLELHGMVIGDTAIDFIIDNSNKVWLLEVQLNYAAERKATRTEDETRLLPYILPTPFAYAKALAEF